MQWSPEQVSGWLKYKKGKMLSHECTYLHVWQNKRMGGDLYTHLRRLGKKYDKRRHGKSTRRHIRNRRYIEARPKIVEDRC